MVQPIVVAKSGEHEETIYCSALASLGVYFRPNINDEWSANFELWLSGSFTKSVRRVSAKDLAKIALWAEENKAPYAVHELNASAALALPPMAYEDYPKLVTKAQVSGTDFVRSGSFPAATGRGVVINFLETLTTGKASAQVAHGLWASYLRNREKLPWTQDFSLELLPVTKNKLHRLAEQAQAVKIVDKGLTEIEPNTLTVVSSFR